jgi:hypothetical protein
MRAVKYSFVTLLLFAGVSFFYAGMGIDIPEVEFRDVASYGVPLGIALIVLAVVWPDWARATFIKREGLIASRSGRAPCVAETLHVDGISSPVVIDLAPPP